MAVEIIYETHSLSEDNESGHATGWLPVKLSAQGRMLAREIGQRHRDRGIVAVFASDLTRAVETAELAFGQSGLPIHLDARLRECNYGELNGMPVAQLDASRLQHVDTPFPGGQSYRQVVEATRGLLEELARDYSGSTVVLIGHAANKWALDCLLCGARLEALVSAPSLGWQEGWTYTLPTGWGVGGR